MDDLTYASYSVGLVRVIYVDPCANVWRVVDLNRTRIGRAPSCETVISLGMTNESAAVEYRAGILIEAVSCRQNNSETVYVLACEAAGAGCRGTVEFNSGANIILARSP